MLSRPEALEVDLVADSGLCPDIERTVKAGVAADWPLLCCLNVDNKLIISDVSQPDTVVHVPEDPYTE